MPFTIVGAAPTNSLFVDSSGRLGLRTATPGLPIHISVGDTPAMRYEQTSASGFTAQTWDIGANEANFFVRDLTGGSRLPFRIRPGAPTSSIDVNAAGNIGMGTASPTQKLDVRGGALRLANTDFVISSAGSFVDLSLDALSGNTFAKLQAFTAGGISPANIALNPIAGNIGIGTISPVARLHTVGSVRFAGVTGCGGGIQSNASGDLSCIVSSRQFKNITGELPSNVALANIMALRPQTGSYKATPEVPEHWLIAEEVAAVDPALIGLNDGKPHVVKTQNVVADLVAVVQHQVTLLERQQQRIDALERRLSAR